MPQNRSRLTVSHMVFWATIAEIFLVFLVMPLASIQNTRDEERRMIWSELGQKVGAWIDWQVYGWYTVTITDTRAKESLTEFLIPSEDQKKKEGGMRNLGNWLWPYERARIEVLFLMIEMIMRRIVMIGAWLPFLTVLICACIFDGMMSWRIRRQSFAFQSPLMRRTGMQLILLGPTVVCGALLYPFAVTPTIAIVAAVIMAGGAYTATKYTQKRV